MSNPTLRDLRAKHPGLTLYRAHRIRGGHFVGPSPDPGWQGGYDRVLVRLETGPGKGRYALAAWSMNGQPLPGQHNPHRAGERVVLQEGPDTRVLHIIEIGS